MARPDRDSWEIFDEALPLAGAIYSPQRVRMVVVGLGGADLLVVSPGAPCSDALFEALSKLGTPRFLLAPNHFHNGGLATWAARFPEAQVVAHPVALPRLKKRVPGVAIGDLSALEAALPEGVRLLCPPMAKQGETWVSVQTQAGLAWCVCDGIVNEKRMPTGPLGWVMRAIGFRAELITNPFFKRLFLKDKAAHKAWVEEALQRDTPTLFIPAHGAVLRGVEVTAQLSAANQAA